MQLAVGERSVDISNPDKVYYPETGTTKADVLRYYAEAAPWVLPHIADRPLNLKRYPEGVAKESFYQKECPTHRPEWLPIIPVPHRDRPGHTTHCAVRTLADLLWVVNTGDIEMHPLLAKSSSLERPTQMVFDLDPGAGVGISDCCRVGIRLRELLEHVGLQAYAKVSGSKGLHVHVPLNTSTDFETMKGYSRHVAERLEGEAPKQVTSNMRKESRRGRVFVDWSQNSRHKSTIAPWSLRATPRPQVAAHVTWQDVVRGVEDTKHLVFTPEDALSRLRKDGDGMAALETQKQELQIP